MKKEKIVILFALLSMVLSVSIGALPTVLTEDAEAPVGAYPDEIIIFLQGDETTVVPMIETGDMQGWLWWLNPENTELAEQSDKVNLIEAFGLYNEFWVNPLETTDSFNPFSIPVFDGQLRGFYQKSSSVCF